MDSCDTLKIGVGLLTYRGLPDRGPSGEGCAMEFQHSRVDICDTLKIEARLLTYIGLPYKGLLDKDPSGKGCVS